MNPNSAETIFVGESEMAGLMRSHDWSQTSLGSPEQWPQSLKTTVRIVLTSRQPMFVWWGDQLLNLYNDAYAAFLHTKHPALAEPASQLWHEIWDQLEPRIASVRNTNEGTFDEALLFIMERKGYPEETYVTFSYSPILNDEGTIGGILCAYTDDTHRIVGERQLALLRELAAKTIDARTFDEACALSASSLGTNPYDLPFTLIYLVDLDRQCAVLAGTSGLEPGHALAPTAVAFEDDSIWPFAEVVKSQQIKLIEDLAARSENLPRGAWDQLPHQAVVVPIASSGRMGKAGILVVGLNPFRRFDEAYGGFIALVSAQIAASIANAQAYEAERKQAAAEREQLLQQEQTLRQQAEIAERRLYALLASIREDFLSFNHDWRVAYVNPQAEITMQRPRDQILGHRIWDLFPDLVGTEYYHRLHQVMRERAPVQFEYYYNTWDVWFDNRVYPSSEGITILCTNITNRKRAEAEREQLLAREQVAREAAEAANRIKDEFLAVVSHELRSPLNPILGWAKLLRTRQLDAEKTDRALEVIERNAQMQAQLINDLLDVSRILRGKLSLETKPIDLAATIQAAMETVRLAAEAKSIDLRFTICDFGSERDNNPTLQVIGDSGRLQQVVWNLLTNAVKFTAEGGRVEVWLEHDGVDRGADFSSPSPSPYHPSHARITVTDTGKGIPSDFLPHVFEQFRQESSATTRRFGGLGLGLAIVRYLVELHGGTIQADSPGDGQGATFTVRLPLMLHQPVATPDPAPSEASIDLQDTRILVVDDDDNTREFLAFLLKLHGVNVIATATADEAITTLTQFMPEVLLSDIGMPDVDGYMLLRQIRALPAEQGGTVPAIALTAYAGEIDYRQAMAAGFQRHMAKPLEPQALIQAIASLLEQSATT